MAYISPKSLEESGRQLMLQRGQILKYLWCRSCKILTNDVTMKIILVETKAINLSILKKVNKVAQSQKVAT